jgi:hypothetical protein
MVRPNGFLSRKSLELSASWDCHNWAAQDAFELVRHCYVGYIDPAIRDVICITCITCITSNWKPERVTSSMRSMCGVYRSICCLPMHQSCGFDTGSPVKFFESQRKQRPWWNPNGSVFQGLKWNNLKWIKLIWALKTESGWRLCTQSISSGSVGRTSLPFLDPLGAIGLSRWLGRLPNCKTWMHGCDGCAWLHLSLCCLSMVTPSYISEFSGFSVVMPHLLCFSSSHL